MRLSIDVHLSFGKPPPDPVLTPSGDVVGDQYDTAETDTGLGFTSPGTYPITDRSTT